MVEMVMMAHQARLAEMAYQARLARKERMAGMVGMVKTERLEKQGSLASKDHLDLMEPKAHLDLKEPKAHLDLLAQAVEGLSTLAGDEQPALSHREQNWFMLERLEVLIIVHKEEQPTTSACQRDSSHDPSKDLVSTLLDPRVHWLPHDRAHIPLPINVRVYRQRSRACTRQCCKHQSCFVLPH